MPIYEYYCPSNHRIYQFYARTLAQGSTVPPCPDNPAYPMRRILSPFAVVGPARPAGAGEGAAAAPAEPGQERMEAALGAMEREFSGVDENDPRAMGRMMRRMADLTGERMDGEMEEVVRKLEEGADPDSLEEQLGEAAPAEEKEGAGPGDGGPSRRSRPRRGAPARDPRLHDYP